jgi:hypothetical protein
VKEFDSPERRRLELFLRAVKCVICPMCKEEFRQNAPSQIYCEDCAEKPREWSAKIRAGFDEFEKFLEKHEIPRATIISPNNWVDLIRPTRKDRGGNTDVSRGAALKKFNMVIDRFRRGFYVLFHDGIRFQNPPWQKFCPVDHTYCKGAILPHGCPRRFGACAYFKGDWDEILQARGVYEIDLSADGRGFYRSRVASRPLLGRGERRTAQKPDDDALHQKNNSAQAPRPAAPRSNRV